MSITDLMSLKGSSALIGYILLAVFVVLIIIKAIDFIALKMRKWKTEPEYEDLRCNFSRFRNFVAREAKKRLSKSNKPAKSKNRLTAFIMMTAYFAGALLFLIIYTLLSAGMIFNPSKVSLDIFLMGMGTIIGSLIYGRALAMMSRRYYFAAFPPKQ